MLPVYLFVHFYIYGDSTNINYILIIANTSIVSINVPTPIYMLYCRLLKGPLREIHSHLQQSKEADSLSVSMLGVKKLNPRDSK